MLSRKEDECKPLIHGMCAHNWRYIANLAVLEKLIGPSATAQIRRLTLYKLGEWHFEQAIQGRLRANLLSSHGGGRMAGHSAGSRSAEQDVARKRARQIGVIHRELIDKSWAELNPQTNAEDRSARAHDDRRLRQAHYGASPVEISATRIDRDEGVRDAPLEMDPLAPFKPAPVAADAGAADAGDVGEAAGAAGVSGAGNALLAALAQTSTTAGSTAAADVNMSAATEADDPYADDGQGLHERYNRP